MVPRLNCNLVKNAPRGYLRVPSFNLGHRGLLISTSKLTCCRYTWYMTFEPPHPVPVHFPSSLWSNYLLNLWGDKFLCPSRADLQGQKIQTDLSICGKVLAALGSMHPCKLQNASHLGGGRGELVPFLATARLEVPVPLPSGRAIEMRFH